MQRYGANRKYVFNEKTGELEVQEFICMFMITLGGYYLNYFPGEVVRLNGSQRYAVEAGFSRGIMD